MSVTEILFLAVALACDCFAISVASGFILRRFVTATVLRMSFLFGLFQAGMPFIGWTLTNSFSGYIERVDHWVAFALLAFIGGRMIRDSRKDDDTHTFDPHLLLTQLLLAVATSIDALAVGVTFVCVGYDSLAALALPLSSIGIVSFIAGIAGTAIGIHFGKTFLRKVKPELFGGIILVCIGIRILLSHLL